MQEVTNSPNFADRPLTDSVNMFCVKRDAGVSHTTVTVRANILT